MTQPKLITLLTDFGLQDVYVGSMKGVITAINPEISIIDLTHQIPPQDLIAGRFALLNSYAYFPDGTIHLVVIDPGVGSYRRGVAVAFSGGFLVGADNGVFGGILNQTKAIAAVELNNSQYWRTQKPSNTFHGRDIFAPVVAHLASGVSLKELGTEIPVSSLVQLPLPEVTTLSNQKIVGCVQYIDGFGNLITNISSNNLQPIQQVIIKKRSIRLGKTYSDGREKQLIALVGSHGYLEIAINCGNAQQELQVSVGEKVFVMFE